MEHTFSAYVDKGGRDMKSVDFGESYTVGSTRSSVDSNRLYSILLDARASAVSENMYDISEKILANEKDNAKNALDRLWALKKNLQQQDTGTVDLLIAYYQNKLDVLRGREEHLKRISKDSRSLLEDKRKKDIEIASVKQELEDCTREMERLQEKLHRAKTKEQELVLIESQLKKELDNNENEIVNGLYEIILSPQEEVGVQDEAAQAEAGEGTDAQGDAAEGTQQESCEQENYDYFTRARAGNGSGMVRGEDQEEPASPESGAGSNVEHTEKIDEAIDLDEAGEKETRGEGTIQETFDELGTNQESEELTADDFRALYKSVEEPDVGVFPKSVVKTTSGMVIGEYFYDPKVYKNKRNYVYHSLFLGEQLTLKVQHLKREPDQAVFTEAVQMVQDACRRVSGNPHLHFEVSTNEIVNEKTLKEVWHYLKEHQWDEIMRFCKRLKAKIEAMGSNYRFLLREQIERYTEDRE